MNVLLYSGGYDSTVLKHFLEFHNVDVELYHALIYDTNAKLINKAETDLILKENVEIKFKSSLTMDKRGEYVPSRNTLLVMDCANKLAHIEGNHIIYIGLIANAEPFPDCTLDWVDSINDLLEVEFKGKIRVVAPFVLMYKDFIYKVGNTLNVDISKTFSCNFENDVGEPCGKCGECLWRDGKQVLKTYVDKKGWRILNDTFEEFLSGGI